MKYIHWKLFGLQRSGNHAILNWLIGLDQENTLFFNRVRPGRDLLDKPSGVSLPEGTRAYATRSNGKQIIQPDELEWFEKNGGRLLLSYENYPIEKFNSDLLNQPVIDRFGSFTEEKNLLVLRNPFNMLPSAEKLLRRSMVTKGKDKQWIRDVLEKRLSMWKNYAFLHSHPTSITRGVFITFLFDRWVTDKDYRDAMAEKLGYTNHDRFLDFVSDAGNGSSFSGTKNNQQNDVLGRWKEVGSISGTLIENNPEVIDYVALIFGEEAVPAPFRGVRG
ncbi:hypothetical protein [Halomonas sp. Alg239-R46]|uniref:hypothetical protein n=1 Tax=Halomonas sp. Alg239-R46 TaxID=2993445 RepID=UPI00248E4B1A|nr:hypothetical protein [Halomonas sp. Alg239-R46]